MRSTTPRDAAGAGALRRPFAPTFWLGVLSLASLLGIVTRAEARSSAEFAYAESRVWTSVVRLVRVDLESPITEKDRDDGYFLFEFPHQGRTYAGSVEVVSLKDAKGPRVRVVVSVAKMPTYVERMVLTKLTRKLKLDYGPPGPTKKERDEDDARKPGEADPGDDDKPGDDASDGAKDDAEASGDRPSN